jgi:cytochrome c-type biogenesis protein CcmH
MTIFALLSAILVMATLALIIWPLLRTGPSVQSSIRQETNLDLMREHLADLEREHAAGLLGEAEYAIAKQELQRRTLEEIPAESTEKLNLSVVQSRKTALLLFLLLPALAVGGYKLLGNPAAIEPLATVSASNVTPEQIAKMVDTLAARLQANPDDNQGWLMLARSYKMLGRNAEAAAAYGKAEAAVAEDPDLLCDYADLLAMLAGGKLDGKPFALVKQALHLDPDHVLALWLAGTAAFDKRDFPDAIVFWERAVRALPPDSADGKTLQEGIAEAKRRSNVKIDLKKSVSGVVEINAKLKEQVSADSTVFILARPTDGSRMPLAVIKIKVAELPYTFTLDDSQAIMGDKRVSTESEVIVEARVSKSGNVIVKEGDLNSKPASVKVGAQKLKLLIDQVVSR